MRMLGNLTQGAIQLGYQSISDFQTVHFIMVYWSDMDLAQRLGMEL
jgi:hypothetical protein